ncbi:hypothetical protein GGX14DRAFT_561471 [Mycena pura]|uniref:Uncharacterized protein n=1 Tax=Mycena pura TaxID=153505 RepID=A0AAD6VNF6_9AGAR|nr:hypothetical protein GGX14DRAFT_561471 [Mycena pura]
MHHCQSKKTSNRATFPSFTTPVCICGNATMQTACLKFICHITTWFSTREPIAKVCSLYLTGHSVEQRQGRYSVLVIFHALPWPALVAPTLFVLQQVADAGAVDEWTPVLSLFVASLSNRSIPLDRKPHRLAPCSCRCGVHIPPTRIVPVLVFSHTTIDLPDSRVVGPHALLVRAAMRLHAMLMYADAGSRARSVRPVRDGHAARCGETLWAAACSMLAADELISKHRAPDTDAKFKKCRAELMRRRRPHARVRVFTRHLHALLYASVVRRPDTAPRVPIEYGYSNGTDEDVSAAEGEETFRMKWSVRCELDAYISKPVDAFPVDERLHVRMLVTTLYMKREKARPEEPLLPPRRCFRSSCALSPPSPAASCTRCRTADAQYGPLQLEAALVEGRSRPPSILPLMHSAPRCMLTRLQASSASAWCAARRSCSAASRRSQLIARHIAVHTGQSGHIRGTKKDIR